MTTITITLPRATVEQALEALDGLSEDAVCQSSHHAKKDRHTSLDVCPVFLRLRAAITALRAALAETERPATLTKPCGSLGEDVSLCQYPDCAGGQAGTICNNWCPGARK